MRWQELPRVVGEAEAKWPAFVIAGSLVCGIALRLIWPEDIEYKDDERWIFEHASALLAGAPWPWVSLPSSIGPPNPGMSLWVFAGLAYVSEAQTGPELARAVQSLNVLALLAFASFACFALPLKERERWLWAGALWAVNPLAIIFERKIWPPSVLPLATVALIACWWYRKHFAASVLCGLIGALMAQVHLGVVFLTAALFAWTWLYDQTSFRWGAWVSGAALGSLPALPWLLEVVHRSEEAAWRWRFPIPHFFTRWVSQPFGFGAEYTLGGQHYIDYLSSPQIAGLSTYAMAFTHAVLGVLFVVVMVRAARAAIVAPRPSARAVLVGDSRETVLINACFWGYGGLLTLITLIGASSHRHYLIVTAPIMAMWCVRLVWAGEQNGRWAWSRLVLVGLCLAQIATSAGLLQYIHRTHVIRGEYGPTWRSQQSGFAASEWYQPRTIPPPRP
jgi:hypothetical protein